MCKQHKNHALRRGYTLVELLVTTLIITVLAGTVLVGISGAREIARENRTRVQIAHLKELLAPMYDAYRTRAIPLRAPLNSSGNQIPLLRLRMLRELMRMEMPDRVTDISDTPTSTFQIGTSTGPVVIDPLSSSLYRSFRRRAFTSTGSTNSTELEANWSPENQGSECLYMIIGSIQDGDRNGLDFFLDREIGDTDGDGMPEILDAWGNPIEFLRWAPGHRSVVQQNANDPDPFDPLKVDSRARTPGGTYAMAPLVVSGGKSNQIDLIFDTPTPHRYKPLSAASEPNDPFATNFGAIDETSDFLHGDNITSHNVNAGS